MDLKDLSKAGGDLGSFLGYDDASQRFIFRFNRSYFFSLLYKYVSHTFTLQHGEILFFLSL